MRTSTDHSLVLAPLSLDPLSASQGSEITVANKTGCDTGIRADVGLVERGGQRLAYAVPALDLLVSAQRQPTQPFGYGPERRS